MATLAQLGSYGVNLDLLINWTESYASEGLVILHFVEGRSLQLDEAASYDFRAYINPLRGKCFYSARLRNEMDRGGRAT